MLNFGKKRQSIRNKTSYGANYFKCEKIFDRLTICHVYILGKPRTYNNGDKQDIFINGIGESLTILTTFISFPLSNIKWFRQLQGGNLADIDSDFKKSTIPSHLPYETVSLLQKDHLKQEEFGIYLVNASNIHGSFLMEYNVIQTSKYACQIHHNS